jgi:quercetin dioxygenase-like cupin family protein
MASESGNIPAAEAVVLAKLVEYAAGSIVSRALTQSKAGSLTLFAFDKGQGLNEHTAPYDAHVMVVEGTGLLTIGGMPVNAKPGEIVRMPANVPHAVQAQERFKMLLVMIRG